LRTLLSMVSLFLGVLAVVVVQAGAEIAQQAALADVELTQGRDGTLEMQLSADGSAIPVTVDTLRGRRDAVATTSTSAIIGEPGVAPINPGGQGFDDNGPSGTVCYFGDCTSDGGQQATAARGQAIELQLTAMTGDIRTFRPFRHESGQWLQFDDAPSMAPRLVLNREAAKGFNRYQIPAEMRVGGATAHPTPRIIGVVDDGGHAPAAYLRVDELLNWLPETSLSGPNSGAGLTVLVAPTATDVEHTLRARLVASGVPEGNTHAEPVRAREQIADQLSLVRWIFLGLAALVLLIGVAGILNVGLATVGERVEEFALRRAVGTPRSLLAGIVLAETLLTGLLTAASAVGVAALALRAFSALFGDQAPFLHDVGFPWQAGVAGVIAGLVAGVLGGLIPALRAARIPIATVMRA
jgi:putative ABC transport system permease protein